MSTSVPDLQRILVCYNSQLAGLAFHLELEQILLLLFCRSLVSAEMASAPFVQSRAKPAPMSERNAMAIEEKRGKVKSKNLAFEA